MFESFDWGGLVKAVAPALVGAVVSNNAANDAAQISQDNAANNRAVIQQQNDKAIGLLQPRAEGSTTGANYFRGVMAAPPTQLTPQQRIRLRDTQLQNTRSLPTALRGSGRATSAALMDANSRAEAGMVQENQGRADAAAGRIMAGGDAAVGQQAQITSGQGASTVNINNDAASDTANAGLVGANATSDAIGNVAHYFAEADKRAQLNGAYGAPRVNAGA